MTLIKPCKYGCGKRIYWDDSIKDSKIKYVEEDTKQLHNYPRCADLLRQLGKSTEVLSK